MANTYASPAAGLPPQSAIHTGRAVFTEAYAVIPRGVMRDIVSSYLPHWSDTRAWVIARPRTGFSETFAQ
jgi:(S)-ureidoglycine aminohydrolase